MKVRHERLQHGVGQGGFHSAKVAVLHNGRRYRFDYVYDCGAVAFAKKSPLVQSIESLSLEPRAGKAGKGVIDALVLSHFDQDHIVGAKRLMKRCRVRRLFLPYLSAQEWMLVLASQANRLRIVQIRALHTLATDGGQLFGVDVTMVEPTGNNQADDPGDTPTDPPFEPNDDRTAILADEQIDSGFPHDLVAIASGTGTAKALRRTLPTGANVSLRMPDCTPSQVPWLLRFWNRGVKQGLLNDLSTRLNSCGFPITALSASGGVEDVLTWLAIPGNRDKAVGAYRAAVNAALPANTKSISANHIANHISLGLYSGPAEALIWDPSCCCVCCLPGTAIGDIGLDNECCHRAHYPKHEYRTGWLGTGDAPLGEADVWADFEERYREQLPQTISIQVPHHGAAPKSGPAFFNKDLLPVSGMNAVIAAGTNNSHGHPATSVKAAIKKAKGLLQLVNEQMRPGFKECFNYKLVGKASAPASASVSASVTWGQTGP